MGASRGSVLIVDDELAVRVTVQEILRRAGYEAVTAESGEEALEIVAVRSFDVALVDLVMPGMDGIELMAAIQEVDPDLVLIVLTARGSIDSAIEALRLGAHNYLKKPCDDITLKEAIDEGIAKRRDELRQKALVGRLTETLRELVQEEILPTSSPPAQAETRTYGPLGINPGTHTVTLEGHLLELTQMEFGILCALAQNPDKAMSGREILLVAQGIEYDEFEAREIVRYHVHGLRRKLGPHADLIRTVRGIGYRLVIP